MTQNLPSIVTNVGGALERVITDIEAYTDERFPLPRRGQFALARLIETRPDLNSEARVALLVDAMSHHGVTQAEELKRLIDEYGIEDTHLALDYLYEVGERSRGTQQKSFISMTNVKKVIEIVINLRAHEVSVTSVEHLSDIIYQIGGLDAAYDADAESIDSAMSFNLN